MTDFPSNRHFDAPLDHPVDHPDQLAFDFGPEARSDHRPSRLEALGEPKNRLVDGEAQTHRVIIYCAGSRGLECFLRPLELFAYKFGVTGAESAQTRVEDLRRKTYAGLWGRPGGDEASHIRLPQSEEWALWAWKPDHLQGVSLPQGFHLHRGALEIEFPFSTPVQAVDDAVHSALKPRSLTDYLASPTGKARLARAGLDPEARLMTRYTLMEVEDRISEVHEIYRIKPRLEFPRLIATLAHALAPLRGLTPTKGKTRDRGGNRGR
jgi:hypothetical protein